jgi:hypothetical protein
MGLYLEGADLCYVTARVTTAAMFKLESFVSRKRPGQAHGEIVDMADNDWASVDRVRSIASNRPHRLP